MTSKKEKKQNLGKLWDRLACTENAQLLKISLLVQIGGEI